MREKPENGDFYDWNGFERRADREGYGEHFDDWGVWWKCWKAGYISAMNQQ